MPSSASSTESTPILTPVQRYSTIRADSSFSCLLVYRTLYPTTATKHKRRYPPVQESLEASLVRIRTTDGRVVGAGFLAGQRHILTCAHVISKALGLSDHPLDPPQELVSLDFPLIPPRTLHT